MPELTYEHVAIICFVGIAAIAVGTAIYIARRMP